MYIRTARTSNSKEPQQKHRLGTVGIKILGGGGEGRGLKLVLGDPNIALDILRWALSSVQRNELIYFV